MHQEKTTDLLKTVVQLWLTPKIGPVFVKKYLTELGFDFYANSPEEFWPKIFEHKPLKMDSKIKLKTQFDADTFLNECKKRKISIATLIDKHYPNVLRKIHAPPPVLLFKGDLPNLENSVAIVGAREIADASINSLNWIFPKLLSQDIVTISGGARGVDTCVAKHTLFHNRKTLVVLGSGLEKIYPPENGGLFEKIINHGGCVLSPFHFDATPAKENFPARNRIIAGLSKVTIVVQAAEKSGALITASFARDEGREVFVIPGPITSSQFEGSNALLLEGATPLLRAEQIFESLGISNREEVLPQELTLTRLSKPADKKAHLDKSENKSSSDQKNPIVELLNQAGKLGLSAEELAKNLNTPQEDIEDRLFDLELSGQISQGTDGLYRV